MKCAENQFVSSHACLACPAGETNAAGDDAAGPDTQCSAVEGDEADSVADTVLAGETTDSAKSEAISNAMDPGAIYDNEIESVKKRKQVKFRKRMVKRLLESLSDKTSSTLSADRIYVASERSFSMSVAEKRHFDQVVMSKPRKVRQVSAMTRGDKPAEKADLKAKASEMIGDSDTFTASNFPDDLFWPLSDIGDCFAVKLENTNVIFSGRGRKYENKRSDLRDPEGRR